MKGRLLIAVCTLAACGPVPESGEPRLPPEAVIRPSQAEIAEATRGLHKLKDAFLARYYEARPVRATELGIHLYDDRLPALDRRGVQQWIDQLLGWLSDLEKIPFPHIEGEDRYEYGILEYALRSQLLELEETRTWVRDPRLYTTTIATGIASVAERPHAPLAERVAALRARMEGSHTLLDHARTNLSAPPALWTQLAVEQTRGLMEFLEADLAAALAAQSGPTGAAVAGGGAALPPELVTPRNELLSALEDHLQWLETDLLPRSTGEYRLGRYLFERKLLYEEHIALNVAELDRLNEVAIREYQEWLARVAAEIDPSRTPRSIMDSLIHDHPAPEQLLGTARDMMREAHRWVASSGIVPLLTNELPVVRETPPYARAGFASMDAPGPFEEGATRAFFNITPVLPEWTESQKRQHLTYFNYPGLLGVTVHETFPGHYVQLTYAREVESDLRRVFTPRSFVEGWAHYAEQMALDAGFTAGDPAVRLGQIRRALQRHARWYAGLHLHAFGTPMDEVVSRFMEIAYFEEFPARREVLRATYDPTYLYYALGRMQILELRKDYQAHLEKEGKVFTLPDFHEQLLRLSLPLPLAREALIPLPGPREGRLQLIRRR